MNTVALSWISPLLLAGVVLLQSSTNAGEIDAELLAFGEPVEAADLDVARGGEAVPVNLNSNQLEATSESNQVSGSVTGANMIGDAAFSGLSGISSVVQNTGNNVIVQDSIIVNIELHGLNP
jgi:hypothetical protein